jgi:hypothetical protein
VYVTPPEPRAGVPDSTPVLGEKLMPVGNVEGAQPENAELESVGVGEPVVVTWKLPAVPTVKPVAPALVMVGA